MRIFIWQIDSVEVILTIQPIIMVMKAKILVVIICLTVFILSCSDRTKVLNEYYPDGIIKKETEMKDGIPNGTLKTYDERGRLKSTATVVNGLYEGWMITYNPLNNKITAKAFYKNDQQNGPVTLYYATGELYREETYVDGRVNGIVKTYWADGTQQAEVEFKMGMPGIGLKEWDQQGMPISQPGLVLEEIDQLARMNTFKLRIYLSKKDQDADFYLGELKDGQFLVRESVKIKTVDGVATLQYNLQKKHRISKRLAISVKTRTPLGNTLLLHRIYQLDIAN